MQPSPVRDLHRIGSLEPRLPLADEQALGALRLAGAELRKMGGMLAAWGRRELEVSPSAARCMAMDSWLNDRARKLLANPGRGQPGVAAFGAAFTVVGAVLIVWGLGQMVSGGGSAIMSGGFLAVAGIHLVSTSIYQRALSLQRADLTTKSL